MKYYLWLTSLMIFSFALACPVGKNGLSPSELKKLKEGTSQKRKAASDSELPSEKSARPWGGTDRTKWKAEAVLANAASAWLNRGWSQKNVSDVLVSVPVKMIFTKRRVYNDGQTNASLQFGSGWSSFRPQLVAQLVKYKNGERKITFSFGDEVTITTKNLHIVTFLNDQNGKPVREDFTRRLRKQNGLKVAIWEVSSRIQFGDMNTNRVVWVRPEGWNDAFPIDFRMAIVSNEDLLGAAGNSKTVGLSPLDPLNIFKQAAQKKENPQLTLLNSAYGEGWMKNLNGTNELRNESIHGEILQDDREIKTGVGGGLTWLVERGTHSRFKNLYTCFDARNFEQESQWGVPSGGGWHEIGDAAETIINDLSTSAVPVGFATGLPWPTPPDGKQFAWGLTDIVTVRLLQPGESVITPAGDQTWKEEGPFRDKRDGSQRGLETSGGGRNYHWFFFPGNEATCTQEWVHHCRPEKDNQFGLSCP